MKDDTIAAIATAPGAGGIAVIRISGPQAFYVADKIFRPFNSQKTIQNLAGYCAAAGCFLDKDAEIDQGIALVFRSPHSFTGEDVVELSCHGGEVITRRLLSAVISAGARQAASGEFSKRAFLNGKINLAEAESILELISANSLQMAAGASRAINGEMKEKIEEIKKEINSLAAHLSAWSDYPEEDVPELERNHFTEKVQENRLVLEGILGNYQSGRQLNRGIKAVLVGRPNVGKSTIFNLLSNESKAIVTEIAGTTRDVLHEEINLEGMPFTITDTAGLWESDNVIEVEGIRRTKMEAERADLILYILEGNKFYDLSDLLENKNDLPTLCVVNKSDLGVNENTRKLAGQFDAHVVVSAQANPDETRRILIDEIKRLCEVKQLDPNILLLTSERQRAAAEKAKDLLCQLEESLRNGETYDIANIMLFEALEALSELTGENVSEAVIEEVFSQFCVGK